MSAAPVSVPTTREFTFVGLCYALYVFGLLLLWPAIIGVIMAYVRRSMVDGTILESHYRWLIRTFWIWVISWAITIAIMAWLVVPHAVTVGRLAQAGDYLNFPWQMIAVAVAGGFVLGLVWLWMAVRLFRGTLRLADGRAIP